MMTPEPVNLDTDVYVTFDKKGNIKSLYSPFNDETINKPLRKSC